jgi:hypothetical protein
VISMEQRLDEVEKRLEAGLLTRGVWRSKEPDGREKLCLYLALFPESGDTTANCPVAEFPQWLANLMPWIDDAGTSEAWPGLVRRFIAALRSAVKRLDTEGWRRLDYRVRITVLKEARQHTTSKEALLVVDRVSAMCGRAAAGELIFSAEWYGAAEAAWVARAAAAAAAAEAAAAAAEAEGAAAAGAAAAEAAGAAWAAEAADRIITSIIETLETV